MESVREVHVLLISFMGFGHVNPMLQLGRLIARQGGCKVSIFISMVDEDRAKLTPGQLQDEPGTLRVLVNDVPCPNIQAGIEWYVAQDDTSVTEMFGAVVAAHEARRGEVWPEPTVIVCDMFLDWGRTMSRHYGVPYWGFNPSPLTFTCVLHLFMQRVAGRGALLEGEAPLDGQPRTPPWRGKKPGTDEACCSTAEGGSASAGEEDVPGVGLVPVECLPRAPQFKAMSKVFERSKLAVQFAASVLVNDVERLVRPAALAQACAKPAGGDATQFEVLCVGPVSANESRLLAASQSFGPEDAAVAAWLDRQAARSVTLVVLGSWCDLCPADLVELARGLQASKRPVLWAFRKPREVVVKTLVEEGSHEATRQPREPVDDASGLPVGFLEEVARDDRLLLRPWVNQPCVLAHPAVGCFLTHCGWNSLTESLALAGVPLLCLPLAADQSFNAFLLTEQQGAGLSLWRSRSGPPGLQRETVCAHLDRLYAQPEFAARALHLQAIAQEAATTETPRNLQRFLARARISIAEN